VTLYAGDGAEQLPLLEDCALAAGALFPSAIAHTAGTGARKLLA